MGPGKRVYTSVARVASVAVQKTLGRRASATVRVQQVADAIKRAPARAAVRGAARGGVVSALALLSYCSYKCAIDEALCGQ